MRQELLAAALVAIFAIGSPAAADTIQTTTTTCNGSEFCGQASSALQGFDSTLGTLSAITLDVTGSKLDLFLAFPTNPGVEGTAHLAYSGPMTVLVNGVEYSFDISGEEDITRMSSSVSGAGGITASGSGSFVIDPSLFSTFIDTADLCGRFPPSNPPIGVCATANGSYGLTDVLQSSSGIRFEDEIDGEQDATYTLTYEYTPFSVPEPATWLMMMAGFFGIGCALRRPAARRPGSCRS